MNDNERDVVLKKGIKNVIIVVSIWIITFIIKGILRNSIKYQATKIYPKEWR